MNLVVTINERRRGIYDVIGGILNKPIGNELYDEYWVRE